MSLIGYNTEFEVLRNCDNYIPKPITLKQDLIARKQEMTARKYEYNR